MPCEDLDPSVLHNSFQNPESVVDRIKVLKIITVGQEIFTGQLGGSNMLSGSMEHCSIVTGNGR